MDSNGIEVDKDPRNLKKYDYNATQSNKKGFE